MFHEILVRLYVISFANSGNKFCQKIVKYTLARISPKTRMMFLNLTKTNLTKGTFLSLTRILTLIVHIDQIKGHIASDKTESCRKIPGERRSQY